MKKHMAIGATLLLTLGTAVAGTLIYEPQDGAASDLGASMSTPAAAELLELADVKAGFTSADYITPKVPI